MLKSKTPLLIEVTLIKQPINNRYTSAIPRLSAVVVPWRQLSRPLTRTQRHSADISSQSNIDRRSTKVRGILHILKRCISNIEA